MTHTSTEQAEARDLAYWIAHTTDNPTAALIQSLHARVQELEAAQAQAKSAIEEALQLQKKFYGYGADTHFALDNWAKKYQDAITQEKQG